MTDQQDFTAASFYKLIGEGKLMGVRCQVCESIFLPPRSICSHCQTDQMTWIALSGRGTLAAFTAVYIGPTFMNEQGFDRHNPYLTGIVELEEGVKISARLLGFENLKPDEVKIGTPVDFENLTIGDDDNQRVQLAFRKTQVAA